MGISNQKSKNFNSIIKECSEMDWSVIRPNQIKVDHNLLNTVNTFKNKNSHTPDNEDNEEIIFYKIIQINETNKILMVIPTVFLNNDEILILNENCKPIGINDSEDREKGFDDDEINPENISFISLVDKFLGFTKEIKTSFTEFGNIARNIFRYLGLNSELIQTSEKEYFYNGFRIRIILKSAIALNNRPMWQIDDAYQRILQENFPEFSNLLDIQIPLSFRDDTYYINRFQFFDFLHYVENRILVMEEFRATCRNSQTSQDYSVVNSIFSIFLFSLGLGNLITAFDHYSITPSEMFIINLPILSVGILLYMLILIWKKKKHGVYERKAKLTLQNTISVLPQEVFPEFVPFFNKIEEPKYRSQIISEHLLYWAFKIKSEQKLNRSHKPKAVMKKIKHRNTCLKYETKEILHDKIISDIDEASNRNIGSNLCLIHDNLLNKLYNGRVSYDIFENLLVDEILDLAYRSYEANKLERCSELLYLAGMKSFIQKSSNFDVLPLDFSASHGMLSSILHEMNKLHYITVDQNIVARIRDWEEEILEYREISKKTIGSRFLIARKIVDFNDFNKKLIKKNNFHDDLDEIEQDDYHLHRVENENAAETSMEIKKPPSVIPSSNPITFSDNVNQIYEEYEQSRTFEKSHHFRRNLEPAVDLQDENVIIQNHENTMAAFSFPDLHEEIKEIDERILLRYEKNGFLYKNDEFLDDFLNGRI